jgi:hypothetical protein
VVVVGTVGIALWTAVPWLQEVGRASRLALAVLAGLALAAVIVAQLAITQGLDHVAARNTLEAADRDYLSALRELNAAERSRRAARARLIARTRFFRGGERNGAIELVLRYFEEIDKIAAPLMQPTAPTNSPGRLLVKANKELNALHQDFYYTLERVRPPLPAGPARLLELASDRTNEADLQRLISRVNFIQARADYVKACKAARFAECDPSEVVPL